MKTQNQNSVNPETQSCQMAVSGSVTKKPINVSTFKNAVSCKYLNRKIEVIKQQPNRNEIVIVRMAENKKDLETPSCQFETIKGKVCVTRIAMSNEGLEALHIAISQYLQNGCLTDR
jgi:tRNA U34 5-carboxymethylaminomethyl modifying GTPase MnmE/TrmE|tara:strand:+ start:1606 stop:1956 length:351 start_codon:yes stop_codon:yes gene_type:complete